MGFNLLIMLAALPIAVIFSKMFADGDIRLPGFSGPPPGGGRPPGLGPPPGFKPPPDKGPKAGDKAPVFKLKSLDGNEAFNLEAYKGKRPVVLFFGSYS